MQVLIRIINSTSIPTNVKAIAALFFLTKHDKCPCPHYFSLIQQLNSQDSALQTLVSWLSNCLINHYSIILIHQKNGFAPGMHLWFHSVFWTTFETVKKRGIKRAKKRRHKPLPIILIFFSMDPLWLAAGPLICGITIIENVSPAIMAPTKESKLLGF